MTELVTDGANTRLQLFYFVLIQFFFAFVIFGPNFYVLLVRLSDRNQKKKKYNFYESIFENIQENGQKALHKYFFKYIQENAQKVSFVTFFLDISKNIFIKVVIYTQKKL